MRVAFLVQLVRFVHGKGRRGVPTGDHAPVYAVYRVYRQRRCCDPPCYFSSSGFGGVKSAMYNWAGRRPSRVEVHITFLPSGLNTGSTSAPGANVMRVFLSVSTSIQ